MTKNKGRFRKGRDPRRHKLTPEDCRKGGEEGFRSIMDNKPWILMWLKKRIKAFYRDR